MSNLKQKKITITLLAFGATLFFSTIQVAIFSKMAIAADKNQRQIASQACNTVPPGLSGTYTSAAKQKCVEGFLYEMGWSEKPSGVTLCEGYDASEWGAEEQACTNGYNMARDGATYYKNKLKQLRNKSNTAKNKYNNQCKTKKQRKTEKCENLARAAGISTPNSSGSTSSADEEEEEIGPEEDGTAADEPEQAEGLTYKKTKPVNNCGSVATFFKFNCGSTDSSSAENSPIFKVLLFIVNTLTTLVGLAAVGGIIAGGIIYSSAGDNAEQTKKGITYVVNALLAILLFAFMFAILNFIIPGGLFT